LLSAEPGGAVLPWSTGMTIATVALIERFRCNLNALPRLRGPISQ
jgi:hypothetical protein